MSTLVPLNSIKFHYICFIFFFCFFFVIIFVALNIVLALLRSHLCAFRVSFEIFCFVFVLSFSIQILQLKHWNAHAQLTLFSMWIEHRLPAWEYILGVCRCYGLFVGMLEYNVCVYIYTLNARRYYTVNTHSTLESLTLSDTMNCFNDAVIFQTCYGMVALTIYRR